MINLLQGDCMDLMKDKPDNYWDLAIVDPPYGIGEDGGAARTRGSKKTNGVKKGWDCEIPDEYYFLLLQYKCKNIIVCGGNYFTEYLPHSRGWIYWRKLMGGDFSDGELIYTSFDRVLREYTKCPKGIKTIHPTQKPVALYKWLLKNYAKPGDKILDTHGGSFSHAIAVHDMNHQSEPMNLSLDIIELDEDYFKAGKKRFQKHIAQLNIFQ